jgi:probable rRNA maturation factor
MKRTLSIRNAHPRLRISRAAVTTVIGLLDEKFALLPGDLAHLSLPRNRITSLKSRFTDPKAKIRDLCPPGELSLVFLTDPALAKIHGDFMADPTATDVITFEGDPLAGLAGEICVSADTAARYVGLALTGRPGSVRRSAAALQDKFAAELTLYLIHGWLHLAGYDDLRPAKKRRMRAAESRAMKLVRDANVLPPFRLA